jgi:hypothetical protein
MSDEDRQAIEERKNLIEARAWALAEDAVRESEAWVRRLGAPPATETGRERWLTAASTVAAYRDQYRISSKLPAGGGAATDAQRAARSRALGAAREAASVAYTEGAAPRSTALRTSAISPP